MKTLDGHYITEQHALSSASAWIWLLEITTSGYGTPLRYTNDNYLISAGPPAVYGRVWPTSGGNTYTTMPFTLDDVEASLDGKFPEYRLRIEDLALSGDLRTRVQATYGMVGSVVRIRVVHSDHLTLTTAAIDESAEVLGCEVDLGGVTLILGIPSLLSRRFPRDKYLPSFCRHKFGGALCQYAQSGYSVTSSSVQFELGVQTGDNPVNRIIVTGVDLAMGLFYYALPKGTKSGSNFLIAKDIGFTVSGSVSNDGFYLADDYYPVHPTYVYVKTEAVTHQAMVNETVLTGVTIQLGYNGCNHTLNACKLRDNSQNFGGSPGISGGVYG